MCVCLFVGSTCIQVSDIVLFTIDIRQCLK